MIFRIWYERPMAYFEDIEARDVDEAIEIWNDEYAAGYDIFNYAEYLGED